jgi:hypothetical protein
MNVGWNLGIWRLALLHLQDTHLLCYLLSRAHIVLHKGLHKLLRIRVLRFNMNIV